MENKRLSNKLNSIFWFLLTAMPLWALLLGFIGVIKLSSNNTILQQWTYDEIYHIIQSEEWFNENAIANFMNAVSISSIQNTFSSLFNVIGINVQYQWTIFFVDCFAYMLTIQLIHLIYDVLKFIIEWCHNLIEKAY